MLKSCRIWLSNGLRMPSPKQLLSQACVAAFSLFMAGLIAHGLQIDSAIGVVCLSSLACLVACMRVGQRQTLLGLLVLVVLSVPAAFSQDNVLLASTVMAITALGLGISARWQLMPVYWLMAVSLCLLFTKSPFAATPTASELLRLVIALLASGVLTTVIQSRWIAPRDASDAPQSLSVVHSWHRSSAYGLMLATAAVITTPIAFDQHWHTTGFWLIITPFLVIRPFVKEAWIFALHRSMGTIAGVLLVILIGIAFPASFPLPLLAITAGMITVVIVAKRGHRALMLTALTTCIVLFNSNHSDLLQIADKRLTASVFGIAIALGIAALAYPLEQLWVHRHSQSE
jgi:hypothetical protein